MCAFALVAAVACAGKDQASTDTTTMGAQAGSAAAPAVVAVKASDFAFEAPAEIPSGLTTFKLTNDSKGFHHMLIVRLDSGKTLADLGEAMKKPGPFPVWAVPIGGPNAPSPTQESNATLDLQPGNYALLCLVDTPGGVPHFAKGMTRALTVTASTAPAAAAPTADIAMSLKEYGFDLSKPVTAGPHTFEVRNTGAQDHEVEVVKLEPGKTANDLVKWVLKPEGPPPGSAVGGALVGKTGAPVYFTADFAPGSYALICFIPDAKDGKPHYEHGMSLAFTVN